MTTIKATCPGCGEVDLTADDILLRIGGGSFPNSYGFSCPDCTEYVEKPADERIVRLLLSGGVEPLPAGSPEPHPCPGAPRFSHDDLLDLHALLDSDDWFTQLLTLV